MNLNNWLLVAEPSVSIFSGMFKLKLINIQSNIQVIEQRMFGRNVGKFRLPLRLGYIEHIGYGQKQIREQATYGTFEELLKGLLTNSERGNLYTPYFN